MIDWNFENTFYFGAIITSIFVIIAYIIMIRRKK